MFIKIRDPMITEAISSCLSCLMENITLHSPCTLKLKQFNRSIRSIKHEATRLGKYFEKKH